MLPSSEIEYDNDETAITTHAARGAAVPRRIPKVKLRLVLDLRLAAPFGMAAWNRCEGSIVFSRVSVCVIVCLSVNAITPEPLEISSRNFQSMHHPVRKRGQVRKWLYRGEQ